MMICKVEFRILSVILCIAVLTGTVGFASRMMQDPLQIYRQAEQTQRDGNFQDAAKLYRLVLQEKNSSSSIVANSLVRIQQCFRSLRSESELDSAITLALENHGEEPEVLVAAATTLRQASHYGTIVDGSFSRGSNRRQPVSGARITCIEQDRLRVVNWLKKAIDLSDRDLPSLGGWYVDLADSILLGREGQRAWRLQGLSDLEEEPNYTERGQQEDFAYVDAPVDNDGNVILYESPDDFADAKSDGQRYRWALEQAKDLPGKYKAMTRWAGFLSSQISVSTLRNSYVGLRNSSQPVRDSMGQLHTLQDTETLAKLANGIQKIELADEYNPIAIYKSIVEQPDAGSYRRDAIRALQGIYMNRRQYEKAAAMIELDPGAVSNAVEMLDAIRGPQLSFETSKPQLAGEPSSVSLLFRNAESTQFSAQRVDMERLITDIKLFYRNLQSNRQNEFGGDKANRTPNFDYLSGFFYRENYNLSKYLTGERNTWTEVLEPRPNHWDKRTSVELPISDAGTYLVEARSTMTIDGRRVSHQARVLVTLQDAILIRHRLEQDSIFRAVDAKTGAPLVDAEFEFFGYRWQDNNNGQPRGTVVENFARKCNANGEVSLSLKPMFNWLTVARRKSGELTLLNFENFYPFGKMTDDHRAGKAYGVAERPVYRPGDTVNTKFWMAYTTYGDAQETSLANQAFRVLVTDARGNKVHEQTLTTDEYGGCELSFDLAESAGLGRYSFAVFRSKNASNAVRRQKGRGSNPFGPAAPPSNPGEEYFQSSLSLRVEEYRKPEFEVKVLAPSRPVALGQTVEARIQAKYLFGAPVTNATAQIKVERTKYTDSFYPARPYDWCYGPGYWWFNSVYDWYPGYSRWCGCFPVNPFGGPWRGYEPPELVLEKEIELDAAGEALIAIDTAIAKTAFGDEFDHEYSISVVVRDNSRRSVVGSGSIVAARDPFKIYTWTDRGFYNVGDTIEAAYQTRMLDGTPVSTEGTLELLALSYDEDGKPQERVVADLEAVTDDQGVGQSKLVARKAGQYRIRLRLKSGDSDVVEGGYIYTVRGDGVSGDDFRFSDLEITPDKMEYVPGDVAKIQIASNRPDAVVAVFLRPYSGVYTKPTYLKLENKTAVLEIPITANDQPNFFLEAYTVYGGQYHKALKEIVVPPEDRVLDVTLIADKEEYLPGEEATVEVQLTDPEGNPVQANVALTAFDRALELIAPDTTPPDIREFFWKWRRQHSSNAKVSSSRWDRPCGIEKIRQFRMLGQFGSTLADDLDVLEGREPQRQGNLDELSIRVGGSVPFGGSGFGPTSGVAMMESADAFAPMAATKSRSASADFSGQRSQPNSNGNAVAAPKIRRDFSDSAIWLASLTTDSQGRATAKFKMPENLTGWKLQSWALGGKTRVGSASTNAVTKKPLLVRLQTPRFLVERDEFVCSTIVHNDTDRDESVKVSLEIVGATMLSLLPGESAEQKVQVGAHEQVRVDWRCRAIAAGDVKLRTYAVADGASDAMELNVPIIVYGAMKTDSWAGTVRKEENASQILVTIPEDRREDLSELTVRVSPSLAAAMLDALPYLADYPYGCTEQTLNRFLPSVLTQRVLLGMGLDLDSISGNRNNLNSQEIGDPDKRRKQWGKNPVFENGKVDEMVETGLNRLTDMQNQDGGWGWFSGTGSRTSAHITAQVVRGLLVAQANDVATPPDVLQRGINWLNNYQAAELQKLKNWDLEVDARKSHCDNTDAFVYHVLTLAKQRNDEMKQRLYDDRLHLSVYAKTLLALATHQLGDKGQTEMLKRNIEQSLVVDEENETASLADDTGWWYWYGSQIEATAMYLKLLVAVEPEATNAPRVVKFLLNNRKHATYWNSTRDTALVLEAFADYLSVSDELNADSTVNVYLGEKLIGSVEFTKANLFEVNNTIRISANAVPSGRHRLRIERLGKGNLYWNVYSKNFSLEDEIEKAGLEVKIQRRYYLLEPSKEELELAGRNGRIVEGVGDKQVRVLLDEEVALKSGRLIEVELIIESKNDYEYLLIEDKKPAGLEAVDSNSGYFYSNGLAIYRELREKHVGLLIERLPRGKFSVSYQLRSETPGAFSALPASIEGMYAPELVGNSRDFDLKVAD